MKSLSVVTVFFAIAVHATGAYALSGFNGPSANGTTTATPSAPMAGVNANDMQVLSVVLPHAVTVGATTNDPSPNAAMRSASMVGVDDMRVFGIVLRTHA